VVTSVLEVQQLLVEVETSFAEVELVAVGQQTFGNYYNLSIVNFLAALVVEADRNLLVVNYSSPSAVVVVVQMFVELVQNYFVMEFAVVDHTLDYFETVDLDRLRRRMDLVLVQKQQQMLVSS
jgi:3'-phosphoadenosine 5'-phosphosulfate sulfotransferase (PAPS reductase)/FAD synthetase